MGTIDAHGALHDNDGKYANQNRPAAGFDLMGPLDGQQGTGTSDMRLFEVEANGHMNSYWAKDEDHAIEQHLAANPEMGLTAEDVDVYLADMADYDEPVCETCDECGAEYDGDCAYCDDCMGDRYGRCSDCGSTLYRDGRCPTPEAHADEQDEDVEGECDRCGRELTGSQVVDGYCPDCDDDDEAEPMCDGCGQEPAAEGSDYCDACWSDEAARWEGNDDESDEPEADSDLAAIAASTDREALRRTQEQNHRLLRMPGLDQDSWVRLNAQNEAISARLTETDPDRAAGRPSVQEVRDSSRTSHPSSPAEVDPRDPNGSSKYGPGARFDGGDDLEGGIETALSAIETDKRVVTPDARHGYIVINKGGQGVYGTYSAERQAAGGILPPSELPPGPIEAYVAPDGTVTRFTTG